MSCLPKLGVGLTFFSGMEQIFYKNKDLINVIEIEPQKFWLQKKLNSDAYVIDENSVKKLQVLNIPKILHSVGSPVGGTSKHNSNQISLLQKMVSRFQSPWISEHLSFNHVKNNDDFFTGFLLPPRQTRDAVKSYIKSINSFKKKFPVAFAFEVGVNYLKPRVDEMSDGEFITAISEGSNSGILLDLHNVWTNHVNGRQSID